MGVARADCLGAAGCDRDAAAGDLSATGACCADAEKSDADAVAAGGGVKGVGLFPDWEQHDRNRY